MQFTSERFEKYVGFGKRHVLPGIEDVRLISGAFGRVAFFLALSSYIISGNTVNSNNSQSNNATPQEITGLPAEHDELWAAGDSERAIILRSGDCPSGGENVTSDTIIELGSDSAKNASHQALQAKIGYILNRNDGSGFVVFCGPSARSGDDWFAGNALIASGTSILDANNGITFNR